MYAETIVSILTAVSAAGAAGAAIATWQSARATQKATEGELLSRFMEEYSDVKMLRALRRLNDWKHTQGENFEEKWRKAFEKGEPEAVEVDLARRHVSHYFQRALLLHESGYVSQRFVKAVGSVDGINVLYDIVEPLEYALNPAYDKAIFDKLRKICGRPKTGRLIRPLPIP